MLKKLLTISALCCFTLANCYAVENACRNCDRDNDRDNHLLARCPCSGKDSGKDKSNGGQILASSEDENQDEEILVCGDDASEEALPEQVLTSNDDEEVSAEGAVASNDDEEASEEAVV